VEQNLESRSTEMKKDSEAVKREQSSMASSDTKGAQKEMSDAAKKAEEDQRFLHEASDNEKKTRESGEKEMKQQKSQIGKLKTRKR